MSVGLNPADWGKTLHPNLAYFSTDMISSVEIYFFRIYLALLRGFSCKSGGLIDSMFYQR
jgi:hypothetical protein